MDEPEAALSTQGCLAALTRMHDLAQQGSQLLVATAAAGFPLMPGGGGRPPGSRKSVELAEFDVTLVRVMLEAV